MYVCLCLCICEWIGCRGEDDVLRRCMNVFQIAEVCICHYTCSRNMYCIFPYEDDEKRCMFVSGGAEKMSICQKASVYFWWPRTTVSLAVV